MTISRQFLKKFLAYAGLYLLFLVLALVFFRGDLFSYGLPSAGATFSILFVYFLLYLGFFCLPLYLIRFFQKRRIFNQVRGKKRAAIFQLILQIILILLAVSLLLVLLNIILVAQCRDLPTSECSASLICYNKVYVVPNSLSEFIQRRCVPYLFKANLVEILSNYFTALILTVYFFTAAFSLIYLGIIKIREFKFLKKKGRLIAGILILLFGLLVLGWAGLWLVFVLNTV